MKKSNFFLILMLVFLSQSTFAQKIGYIDTEFITSKMPDYDKVQKKLDAMTQQWITEVTTKNEEVVKLEKEFKLEEVLLTEDLRQ